MAEPFTRFVAVDWTGAKGMRHRAIAVAEAEAGRDAPRIVRPGHRWSRTEILDFVQGYADRNERALIGFDFSFAFPFMDAQAYFPGAPDSLPNARALWAEVAEVAEGEPDLGALGHVAHRRAHYWLGAADGPRADRARLRVVEEAQRDTIAAAPSSVFVLLGAAQCGKASLAGMRLLTHLRGVPVWPFDPVPERGPAIVELYCRVFAAMGGVRGKIRDRATLNRALVRLGSEPTGDDVPERFDDHFGDALISAAGMRAIADDPRWWSPSSLTAEIACTEGWTFGIA